MTCARSAPGRRRLTPEHHHATAIAARFDGLPAGVTKKSQLLAAFKQASEALGVSARLRDAVDTLMSWSEQQDWLGDSRPIVWPSNQRLQDAWGISKRQVQNILNRLIRLGLITAVDGTEGRRWGKRDKEGRIIEAYGFDLSPLAVRHDEFVATAAEHRKHCAQRDTLRRRLTIARKAIQQIAETALEHGSPGRDWRSWLRQTEALCRRPPSALDLDVLPALVEQLEAIRSEGDAALAAFFNPVESAPAGEVTCAANTATNTLSADKSATCNDAAMKSNGCGRSGSSSPAGHDQALAQNAATAARLGVSESHAGRLAKRLDATRPSLKRMLTETEKEHLKALYTDGAPLNAIAAQLHIYKARIHREIAAMGIERRRERKSETVLSPGQTETLLKLYFNTDTSVRAICEAFALPESSLYRIIDRQGGGRRTAHSGIAHGLSPEQQERIRDLYRDPGRTIPEICDLAGVSEDTLYRTLALLGEPRRMESTKTKMHDPEMRAELKRLYLDTTVTTEAIRARIGLSKKTFHNLVRSLDLPLRNPGNRTRRRR